MNKYLLSLMVALHLVIPVRLKEINPKQYQQVKLSPGKVSITEGAEWCPACRDLDKTLRKVSTTRKDYEFYHIDVEGDQMLLGKDAGYPIEFIPFTMTWSGGKLIGTKFGTMDSAELEQFLNQPTLEGPPKR